MSKTEVKTPAEFNLAPYQEGADFYAEKSEFNPKKSERIIPAAAFYERMKEVHDVSREDFNKVVNATNFETTVASVLAMDDAVKVLQDATADDLKNDDWRRNVQTSVRLPTPGGNTEVTFTPERHGINPLKSQQPDAPTHITSFGRIGTRVVSKGRIDKGFHDVATSRIKGILGI